jgi:hypothetical protein
MASGLKKIDIENLLLSLHPMGPESDILQDPSGNGRFCREGINPAEGIPH